MTFREKLTADLWIIDALLTGGDPRSGRGDENQLVDEGWLVGSDIYYLSDGGYSRLFVGTSDHKVGLSSESTDRVKEKWDNYHVQPVRRRINDLIREYYTTEGKVWS